MCFGMKKTPTKIFYICWQQQRAFNWPLWNSTTNQLGFRCITLYYKLLSNAYLIGTTFRFLCGLHNTYLVSWLRLWVLVSVVVPLAAELWYVWLSFKSLRWSWIIFIVGKMDYSQQTGNPFSSAHSNLSSRIFFAGTLYSIQDNAFISSVFSDLTTAQRNSRPSTNL